MTAKAMGTLADRKNFVLTLRDRRGEEEHMGRSDAQDEPIANLTYRPCGNASNAKNLAMSPTGSAERPRLLSSVVRVFGAVVLALAGLASNAGAQADAPVLLPWPSSMSQPAGTALHATTWAVTRLIDHGRSVRVDGRPMLQFDWADLVGASDVLVFDGCQATTGTLMLSTGRLTIMMRDPAQGCTASPAAARLTSMLAATSSGSKLTPANPSAATTDLTITVGAARVELTRAPPNDLVDTGWIAVLPGNGPQLPRRATLAFGPTRFSGDDACNTFSGSYLMAGADIVVGYAKQTAAACDFEMKPHPYVGVPRPGTKVVRTGDTLRLTVDGKTITYRQAKVQQRPLLGAPAPNATAPPAIGAVVGKWVLVGLDGDRRHNPAGTTTIEFRPDGTFTGASPCETLSGEWSQAALTMETTVISVNRTSLPCDAASSADNLALGDLLAFGHLAVGRGDITLSIARRGSDISTGISFTKP